MAGATKNTETQAEEIEAIEVKAYKVKKDVTVDKLYKKGSTIYLPEGKIKESLISNKFI
jgi:hypothetical protein